jgi:glycosyltransferase involved in cell wall biosynthesis
MGSPRFSIITVCYNERDQIEATCASIVGQTFKDFEWIVIDGGSTDGTLDILHRFKPDITTLVSEPDEGIYDAMNKGIKRAKGLYLLFMNGGDAFAGNKVLNEVAQAPECDLISGDMIASGDEKSKRVAPDQLTRDYFKKTTLPHQSSFIARRLFQEHGLYDCSYEIVADLEFFARIFHSADPTYCRLPLTIAVYDDSGISSNAPNRWKKKAEDHRVRWKYYPSYRRTLKSVRQVLRAGIRKLS